MAYAKIRPRRGTKYEFSVVNPILAEGEIVVEVPESGVGTGLSKFKIGDGISKYNELPYAFDGASASSIIGGGVEQFNLITLRTGTTQEWETIDPVLELGEPVFDSTKNSIKIGDGVHKWTELEYIGGNENFDFGDEGYIEPVDPTEIINQYFDPTTRTATEANFIAFLERGLYTPLVKGYKVQLSNSVGYNNGTWIIVDVNHDPNQPNTYDLMNADIFNKMDFTAAISNNIWRDSTIRTWLNNTFYTGFSSTFKNHINTIRYESNGSVYEDDRIIIPSATELNITVDSSGTEGVDFVREGYVYSAFNNRASRIKKVFNTNNADSYWTRSRCIYDEHPMVWFVASNGQLNPMAAEYGNTMYVCSILRVS